MSMVKHETTKQLQAAERAQARAVEEAASIRQMLESASGEEACRLLDDLRDAEGRAQAAQGRADETQRAMSVRLLGLVARRWVMAAVVLEALSVLARLVVLVLIVMLLLPFMVAPLALVIVPIVGHLATGGEGLVVIFWV